MEPVVPAPIEGPSTHRDVPLAELLARFGLSAFRPGQDDVIRAILEGHDCLCIMPTGGGKSLCYQLPAIAREGVTIVVSPLIALMKDQVDALARLGIRATCINSSLTLGEQSERMSQLAAGAYQLVYIAPERLKNARFQESLRGVRVHLLAIDEAHCISQWGHDFRPDYARLGKFREQLGFPQTIALTATATSDVRQDVVQQLKLRSPQVYVTGFARPNLGFEVWKPNGEAEKTRMLEEFLEDNPGSGIIYAATRKRCEELYAFLQNQRTRKVGLYHGGLDADERRSVQDEFMSGALEVMIATNAFGMGINKSDLRFVIHYNMPGSLEAYYQEAGRAGRDGLPSRCLLLYSYADRFIQQYFIDNHYPPREDVAKVYEHLRATPNDPVEITLQELKDALRLSLNTEGIAACEKILERAGGILRLDSTQNRASFKLDSDLPTLVDLLPKEAKVQRRVLRAVERIVGDRRFEWVHVSPQRLLGEVDLDREALNRAMRELVRLECFDYIAPFRGRAIHVPDRSLPFRKLEIDFAELDRRKQFEYEKLERMVRYAETRQCRQWEILDYFGDRSKAKCGTCDNCGGPVSAAPVAGGKQASSAAQDRRAARQVPMTPLVVEAVRIALSGVARTHSRFGKHMIAKMLCGSKSAKVTQLKLDRLSTFGLLEILTQDEALEFLDALLQAELLQQNRSDPDKPRLELSPLGDDVMRGRRGIEAPLEFSARIAAKLNSRTLREEPVGVRTSVSVPVPDQVVPVAQVAVPDAPPPDVTVPDAPVNSSRKQTGTRVDQVSPRVPRPSERAGSGHRVDDPAARPAYYWTWKLLVDGYSLAECRAIRGLADAEVLAHLQRAADEGLRLESRWLFTPDEIEKLEAVVPADAPVNLRSAIRELPGELTPVHVQLFARCRFAEEPRIES